MTDMNSVIKQNDQNPKLIRRLETVNVNDHLIEAQAALREARRQAQAIVRQAQSQARTIRAQAQKAGFDDGFRRGHEAGTQTGHEKAYEDSKKAFAIEQEKLISAMSDAVAQFERQKRELLIDANRDVALFAKKVAERVTKTVGAVHPGAAAGNLEAAMQLVGQASGLQVRLHPRDAEAARKFLSDLTEGMEAGVHVDLVEDESVTRGGCVLTGRDVEVDATLESQLAEIARLMCVGTKDS